VNGNTIQFIEKRSHQYGLLFSHLSQKMIRELPPHRHRALLFHEAVHYCRMLTYRVTLNPTTAPVFYGIATRLFAAFMDQYSTPETAVPKGQVA
jgi:hypothetical protein